MGIGMIVAGLASVIIGEGTAGSWQHSTSYHSSSGRIIVYRLAIAIALLVGFRASDLKLITAVLVVIALVSPRVKDMLNLNKKASVTGS